MGMLIILFLVVAVSMGSSYLLLFGVSDWWKLANSSLPEDEQKITKNKALSKVTMAFTLWATMLVFVINSMQMGMMISFLQAAGVDVSAIQGQ